MMELDPIVVPAGWTPEKDLDYYLDRWAEPDGDYFAAALARVAECYEELVEVADSAIRHFEQHDPRLVAVHPATLTLAEKLRRLAIMTNGRNAPYEWKTNCSEHLHNALWADQERRRVMENYYVGEERSWLFSLCELADCLGCAATQLSEAMKAEPRDYGSST